MKFLTMILMMGVLGACAQSVRLGSVVMKDVVAVTNELDATAIAAINVATGELYQAIAAIPAGSTARVERVWWSSTNYVDGDGVKWEIVTRTNDTYTGWDIIINNPITIIDDNGQGVIPTGRTHWPEVPYPLWTDQTLSLNAYSFHTPTGSDKEMFVGYYYKSDDAYPHRVFFGSPSDLSSAQWFANYGSSTNDPSTSPFNTSVDLLGHDDAGGYAFDITLQYVIGDAEEGVTITTNAIDRTVTTNGTVIIIGQTSDDAGTITQQVARAGSSVITNSFFGRAEAEAAISAIPLHPTNAVSGWLMYDTGSNVWLQVSVSNFSFTVHEVL